MKLDPIIPALKLLNALFLMTSLTTIAAFAGTDNFDRAKPGEAPAGWIATQTGEGAARWTVEQDGSAPGQRNVLKQSGVAKYPVCFKEGAALKDGFVAVQFKPLGGKDDQAGGVIWRVIDADNYYVAHANALEDIVTIYHTIKGRRVAFQNVNRPVKAGVWHTLRVDFRGNRIVVTFDGEKVIEATDDSFADEGKVGVWTKADSVTLFADFNFGGQ